MAKSLALGTVLRIESDTPDTFIAIGNLTSIGVPSPTKATVDVTDFDSDAIEKLAALPDNGELAFSGFFNYANAGQALAMGDAHDPDAPVREFQIDFERQDVRFEFEGQILSFAPNAPGPNEAYTFDGTISVSGAVTITSPIPGS